MVVSLKFLLANLTLICNFLEVLKFLNFSETFTFKFQVRSKSLAYFRLVGLAVEILHIIQAKVVNMESTTSTCILRKTAEHKLVLTKKMLSRPKLISNIMS